MNRLSGKKRVKKTKEKKDRENKAREKFIGSHQTRYTMTTIHYTQLIMVYIRKKNEDT